MHFCLLHNFFLVRHVLVIREIVIESHNLIPRNYFKINFLKSCTMTVLAHKLVTQRRKTRTGNWTSVDSAVWHYVWYCSWMGPFLFSSLFYSNLCYGFFEQFWPSLQRFFFFKSWQDLKQLINCFEELITSSIKHLLKRDHDCTAFLDSQISKFQ